MTDPRYVNDLSNVYTEMYTPAGRERPLTEQQVKDARGEEEEHDYDIPKWKRLLTKHAAKEKFKRPPYAHTSYPREETTEEEEQPGQDVGPGSAVVSKYIDVLELKNQTAGHQAQQYLETIIDNVPTAAGGVNIHRIIKDAFIAGTKAI